MKTVDLIIKRIIDVSGAVVGLICLSPVLILTALVIKVAMPGPVFFTQRRVGKDGRVFNIIKFRTMTVNKEIEMKAEKQRIDSRSDKERTTRTGAILRRLKIDEVPQLFNVLKGEMSLVGPRPTLERHVNAYDYYQKQRLLVKPGMTGLAQVSGGTKLTWDERIALDIEYIERFGLFLDFRIILKTIEVVIFGEKREMRVALSQQKKSKQLY